MKTSSLLIAIAVTAFAGSAAFAADAYTSPNATSPAASTAATTGYVADSPITSSVKERLKAERVNSFANIQVNTDANGVVWLKGMVDTQAEADRAVALAKGTDNVKSVNSEITVKPAQ